MTPETDTYGDAFLRLRGGPKSVVNAWFRSGEVPAEVTAGLAECRAGRFDAGARALSADPRVDVEALAETYRHVLACNPKGVPEATLYAELGQDIGQRRAYLPEVPAACLWAWYRRGHLGKAGQLTLRTEIAAEFRIWGSKGRRIPRRVRLEQAGYFEAMDSGEAEYIEAVYAAAEPKAT